MFFISARHIYFHQILDSIRSWLAGWKTKCLSFGGRLTVVRHVLSFVSLHISLFLPLPSKTCLLIEQLMGNFLWSANPDRLKSNRVRWEMVCLPKSEGGLGLRRVKEFNEACLLNLSWSTINVDSLWANWFRVRLFGGLSIWNSTNPRGGLCNWMRLGSLFSILQRDSKWIVGDGQSINLWFDNWIVKVQNRTLEGGE